MAKKYFISIIFIALCSLQVQAQSFSIKITQVYPAGSVVYGDSYNLSGELDKAEASLRNQYTGKNANYIMELTRPSGKETKQIQNIRWIRVVNGTKENWNTKPSLLPESYPKPTTIEIYACNNNGAKTDSKDNTKIEYNHYFKFYKDKEEIPIDGGSNYQPFEKCKKSAEDYFSKTKKGNAVFFEVRIFKEKDIVVDSINNRKEYNLFTKETKQPSVAGTPKTQVQDDVKVSCDSLQSFDKQISELRKSKKKSDQKSLQNTQSEAFIIAMNCMNIDSTYSWENIGSNLSHCKKAVNNYWIEGSKDFDSAPNLALIKSQLEKIENIMDAEAQKNFKKLKKGQWTDFVWKNFETGKKGSMLTEIGKLINNNNVLKNIE